MPGFTFHPEYERHLSYVAVLHCARHYWHLNEVRHGRAAAAKAGGSLLVGIGMDEGVGAWWKGATVADCTTLAVQAVRASNPDPQVTLPALEKEVADGMRAYAAQWDGIRSWGDVEIHPYENEARVPDLVIDNSFLCMPDLLCTINGVRTVVDFKTGKYAYDPTQWLFDPQMLTYCLNQQERHPGEPVQFLIDYMQRPQRKAGWVFPITYPVPFDEPREKLARSWMATARARVHDEQARLRHPELAHEFVEAWPRDPAACRMWYGRCEFWEACFGAAGGTDKMVQALAKI